MFHCFVGLTGGGGVLVLDVFVSFYDLLRSLISSFAFTTSSDLDP